MTKNEFQKYKVMADRIIDILMEEDMSSIYSIELLYRIIRGYPAFLDNEHVLFEGEYFESMEELTAYQKELFDATSDSYEYKLK